MYLQNSDYRIPVKLLKGHYENSRGINTKKYTETETVFNVSCKSYGGTEKTVNNVIVIEDTMIIETWYRKDVTSMDAIQFLDDDSIYEVINNPENINRANKVLVFKVRRYDGGI